MKSYLISVLLIVQVVSSEYGYIAGESNVEREERDYSDNNENIYHQTIKEQSEEEIEGEGEFNIYMEENIYTETDLTVQETEVQAANIESTSISMKDQESAFNKYSKDVPIRPIESPAIHSPRDASMYRIKIIIAICALLCFFIGLFLWLIKGRENATTQMPSDHLNKVSRDHNIHVDHDIPAVRLTNEESIYIYIYLYIYIYIYIDSPREEHNEIKESFPSELSSPKSSVVDSVHMPAPKEQDMSKNDALIYI